MNGAGRQIKNNHPENVGHWKAKCVPTQNPLLSMCWFGSLPPMSPNSFPALVQALNHRFLRERSLPEWDGKTTRSELWSLFVLYTVHGVPKRPKYPAPALEWAHCVVGVRGRKTHIDFGPVFFVENKQACSGKSRWHRQLPVLWPRVKRFPAIGSEVWGIGTWTIGPHPTPRRFTWHFQPSQPDPDAVAPVLSLWLLRLGVPQKFPRRLFCYGMLGHCEFVGKQHSSLCLPPEKPGQRFARCWTNVGVAWGGVL